MSALVIRLPRTQKGKELLLLNIAFHDKKAWRRLQNNGMSTDVSWCNRASRYAALYREVAVRRNQAHCLPSAPMRQIERLHGGRVSSSS